MKVYIDEVPSEIIKPSKDAGFDDGDVFVVKFAQDACVETVMPSCSVEMNKFRRSTA